MREEGQKLRSSRVPAAIATIEVYRILGINGEVKLRKLSENGLGALNLIQRI